MDVREGVLTLKGSLAKSARRAASIDRKHIGLTKLLPQDLKRWLRETLEPRQTAEARHFIKDGLSIPAFFAELQAREIRYVVLRWFDTLPHVEPGEDIDLLVADEHMERLLPCLSSDSRNTPCDVYSVSGIAGSRYCGGPYYPPHLAREILRGSILKDGLFRVPRPEHHFLSLAYHAVYHKGPRSGLRSRAVARSVEEPPEHDYEGVLTQLATDLGLSTSIDLEGLEDTLAWYGWRPPEPMLAEIAQRNDWVKSSMAGCPS